MTRKEEQTLMESLGKIGGWEYFLDNKLNKNNWELAFRKLIDMDLPSAAKNHFEPWDLAYIQKLYEDYTVKWMWKLVKNLAKKAFGDKK